jgi:hypothetical protein
MYLAGAKNSDSWHARMGDLQHDFTPNVLIVPSSALAITMDGEHLSCDVLSLSEMICFESLKFITNSFGGLNLSLMRDGSGATIMGSTYGGTPSLLRAMTWDSVEEVHMALDAEGRIDLPSPRRHDTGASTALTTTIPWPETTLTAQAMTTILLRQEARALARGGKDPDDGPCSRSSSWQGRGSHSQL